MRKPATLLTVLVLSIAGLSQLAADDLQPEEPSKFRGSGVLAPRLQRSLAAEAPAVVSEIFVQPGDLVKAGDMLVVLRSDALEASVEQARASNDQSLLNIKLATARFQLASARVEAVSAMRDSGLGAASATDLKELRIQREIAELEMARAKAAVDASQQSLVRRRRHLERLHVRAPIDGRVSAVHVEPAGVLDRGAALVDVVSSSELVALVRFSAFAIPRLQQDQVKVLLRCDVIDRPIEGVIHRVDHAVAERSQTVLTEILLDAKDAPLRPGMAVTVEIR